jgi:ATP phosphoribosyltransferase regulatory subunit
MMGIRADTTPQVARIDAHVLNRRGVSRLCYAGSVLHTLPSGLGKSRQPFQVGAELYGHASLAADIEIEQLTIDVLTHMGISAMQLDIGHPAIFRALVAALNLSSEEAEQVFLATTKKDIAAITAMPFLAGEKGAALRVLPTLYGGVETIDRAHAVLPALPAVKEALQQLATIAQHFASQGIKVSVDLGELGGFNYESGIVFAVFAKGAADAVARGGRYDEIGKAFGRARPATGFSTDLKALLPLVADAAAPGKILAPHLPDAVATKEIARLRAAGEIVVSSLSAAERSDAGLRTELGCNRELIKQDGRWVVVNLPA